MSSIFNLLKIIPNVISDEHCAFIIEEYSNLEKTNKSFSESSMNAVTGVLTESTFKAVSLVPHTHAFQLIHQYTQYVICQWLQYLTSMQSFNISAFKDCLRYSHDYRVLKYDVGSSIHPHTDWDLFTFGSCSFALNDNYEGGNFSFFNGRETICLNKGDAIIWPADCFWVHEITPVTSGTRYSINTFINSIPENIKIKLYKDINTLYDQFSQSPYRFEIKI